MNTMLSLSRTSCQWRMIPKDLLPWECVSCYFIKWKNEDFIVSLVDKLYSNIRVPSHQETPDTGLIDFRNAKTSFHANANRSFNEKGEAGNRKQYNIINNQRELMPIAVHAAKIYERKEASKIIEHLSRK